MYEYRSGCDGRLKTEAEGSTRLGHTGLRVGTNTTKDRDEVHRREVCECDG
jgi:hypothetical protein